MPLRLYALPVISGRQTTCDSRVTLFLRAAASTPRDCCFVKNSDKLRLAVGASLSQNICEMVPRRGSGNIQVGRCLREASSRDQLGDDACFRRSQAKEIRKDIYSIGDPSLAIDHDKASDRVFLAGRNNSGTGAKWHDMHDERRHSIFIAKNERPSLR